MKTGMRYVMVAIAICSWVAISNHCAVNALIAKAEPAQADCPFHPKPAKQKEPSSNIQCCKVLRAVFAAPAKTWARDDARFSDVDLRVVLPVVFAEAHGVAPLLLDTGPPGKTSFGQLIGSVRAHAPPLFA